MNHYENANVDEDHYDARYEKGAHRRVDPVAEQEIQGAGVFVAVLVLPAENGRAGDEDARDPDEGDHGACQLRTAQLGVG